MQKFNRPYVRNYWKNFQPTYLPGENYSLYINTDYPTDDTEDAFELYVINLDGSFVATCSSPPSIVMITPSLYNIYVQNFVFPLIKDGYYYLQIFNIGTFSEQYRSNIIRVSSDCVYTTTPIKFRHNDQLYGFRYDLLPNFYQLFRLPICQIKSPEIRSERDQYRQASNGRELRNSKSFRDIVLTLEMYWSNDEDLVALSSVNEHSEVYISGNRLIQLTQIKIDKPSEMSNQSKATFEAIVNDYNLNMNEIDNYGDTIIFGGNGYTINNNTFVEA